MVIGGIYIATTIVSILMIVISDKAFNERLDREGYIYNKTNKGIFEKTREAIINGLILLCPVINFLLGCYLFFCADSLYESDLKDGLFDGTIRKKTSEEIEKEEQQKNNELKKQNVKEVNKEVIINKPYSLMTDSEKLAVLTAERDFLLSINKVGDNKSDESKPYNDKGSYRK